jgi:hypothetical protein
MLPANMEETEAAANRATTIVDVPITMGAPDEPSKKRSTMDAPDSETCLEGKKRKSNDENNENSSSTPVANKAFKPRSVISLSLYIVFKKVEFFSISHVVLSYFFAGFEGRRRSRYGI